MGGLAILIGLTGVLLHLDSAFFYERTIRSLAYSAPFAAPLAYTGLGFLLLLNRMVNSKSGAWAQWVLFMTLGGFVGNFIFSLADHAGNGFFIRTRVGAGCGQCVRGRVSGDSVPGDCVHKIPRDLHRRSSA